MILWRAFQPRGFVTDAYVARKKDKRGNSFGFVRYVGVENVGATLATMNTVKIFEAKVSVSLAKYDKSHKKFIYTSKVIGEKAWKPKDPVQRNQQGYGVAPPGGAVVREGQSYASLLQKDVHVTNLGSKMISLDDNDSKYPLHCMGRSIHGVAKNLTTLNRLHSILNNGGLDNHGLSYVGGLSVLLTLGNPGIVREIISNHSELLSNTFSRFHVWNGEDLPMEQVVTLRITGVPVHLRENSLFDRIGNLFGRVVQESTFSWLESDNSDSSVKVLVPLGKRIEETVVLQWKDRRSVIWVAETTEVWKPDLDDEKISVESGSESDNNDDENQMVDEVEEGEIRPDSSADGDRNDNRHEETAEGDKPPSTNQKDGMQQVHGDVDATVHVSMPDDVNGETNLDHNDMCNGGNENMENPNDLVIRGDPMEENEVYEELHENLMEKGKSMHMGDGWFSQKSQAREVSDEGSTLQSSQFDFLGSGPVGLVNVGDRQKNKKAQVEASTMDKPKDVEPTRVNSVNHVPDLNIDITQKKSKVKKRNIVYIRKKNLSSRNSKNSRRLIDEDIEDGEEDYIREDHVDRFWEVSSSEEEWTENLGESDQDEL
ncbi:putative nucleotide-binding alpha-beta plait domain superfamily, RNA-binding domain superfamily [Helianthus annuus]|nr:putative nucleotide-binding alpha-beta plait domain superfamily, RNA-binding domain superfamily [Helianthus annuus]